MMEQPHSAAAVHITESSKESEEHLPELGLSEKVDDVNCESTSSRERPTEAHNL
jgi:hypothetical protein